MEEKGLIKTLQSLLPQNDDAKKWAETSGLADLVAEYLSSSVCDLLEYASSRNCILLVCLLLRQPQSTESCNKLLFDAIKRKHHDLVHLLVGDPRVQPTSDILVTTVRQSSADLLKLLLANPRVDSSACESALDAALLSYRTQKVFTGYYDFDEAEGNFDYEGFDRVNGDLARLLSHLELLLADERVDPSIIADEAFRCVVVSSIWNCGFLLLRPSTRPLVKQLPDLPMETLDVIESTEKEIGAIERNLLSCLNVYLVADLSALCLGYLPDYLACSDFPILFKNRQHNPMWD
jgi:hypothetical protein